MLKGRFTTMPGLFLPSRLLEILYKINPSPPDDVFSEIALLVWIRTDEVKRYFKEANEQDTDSFEKDKLRDKWKTTDLYKTNSCGELREKCKKAGLSPVGVKHQLVQRLYENTTEDVPPDDFKSNYNGNVENLPASLKGLRNLSTAQIKYVLRYHGVPIYGNREELILRLTLLINGQYHCAFYQEQNEILETIKDAEELAFAERLDYLKKIDDTYRKRTYSCNDLAKSTDSSSLPQADALKNLHQVFNKLRNYISILRELNNEKSKILKAVNINGAQEPRKEEKDSIFDVGSKVKVKWCGDELKGTGWKAGWYTAYVKSSDPLQDQIVVEHVSEPEHLYTLDVSPMLGEGSLRLG
jgi:hypothetical protein